MIIDKKQNLMQYASLGIYAEKVLEFIALLENTNVSEGRYNLIGDDLFALVQKYETKDPDTCYPESHIEYIDIQYVLEGAEKLICDFADELKIREDRTPASDIRFHEKKSEKSVVILEKQMFAILFPQDAHTPGLRIGEASEVRKVVFKIKVK